MRNRVRILFVLALAAMSAWLARADSSGDRASAAVTRWSARGRRLGLPAGRRVREVVSHAHAGAVFHEVRFQGGGFAVTDASDPDTPVIAFSESGEIVECDENPLWTLLRRHLELKAASGMTVVPMARQSVFSVSDLRVAPLVKSKWDQKDAAGGYCYDYYTPNHYHCGCVATAMAQIMRYHEYPANPSRIETNVCRAGADIDNPSTMSATNLTMKGGSYDWQGMPYVPGYGCTESNREAIGRLTYDCGVAMHMQYSGMGSGASDSAVHLPFRDTFGYTSAYTMFVETYESFLDDGDVRNMVLACLDAGSPVALGVARYVEGSGFSSGHQIVADGYGYADDVCYVHLNMGWSGSQDAWYALPDIGTAYGFNVVSSVTYNIFPSVKGAVVSGHVTEAGTNVAGIAIAVYARNGSRVAQTETDSNGVYSVILGEGRNYRIVAEAGSPWPTNDVSTGVNASIVDYDWETGWGYYESRDGLTCGNRWGIDFTLESPPEPPAPQRLHVSVSGSDATGTGSEESPFATINAALAKAKDGDVVIVGPGTYAGGVRAVAATVTIVSAEGPETTVIDGGDVTFCYAGAGNSKTVLSGFTLQYGCCQVGAGVYGGTVSNCVIRFCYAFQDDMYDYYGVNSGCGAGAYDAVLYDTFLYGNGAERFGGGVAGCELVRCTVYGNQAQTGSGADCDSTCRDSIVWGNVEYMSGQTDNWESWGGRSTSFDHSCTLPLADGEGNVDGDPRFVAPDDADFRLRTISPCRNAASDGGNMGAYRGEGVPGVQISTVVSGPGTVTPTAVVLNEGESVTFVATAHHPFLGFETNGVLITAEHELTIACPGDDMILAARFERADFHVDAVSGNDANDGWTWASAKRSIQAALDVVASGERVEVKPGTYAETLYPWTESLTIVSTEGRERTIVDPEWAGPCILGLADPNTIFGGFTLQHGCYWYGAGVSDAVVSNCVIRDCYAVWQQGHDSGYGGGACSSMLFDCLLLDNAADDFGGGASGCQLVRCTVYGNQAQTGSGVDCDSTCQDSIVRGNVSYVTGMPDNWETYQRQSTAFDHSCTTPLPRKGAGNLDADPRFVSESEADFRLYEISPCIGKASDGGNMGAYRGEGVKRTIPELPGNPSAQDLAEAVAAVGYADSRATAYVGASAENYNRFRTWATESGLGTTAVVLGLRSYLSFALREIVASPYLLGDATATAFTVPSIVPNVGGEGCELTVRLTDGGRTVPLRAAKDAYAGKVLLGTAPERLEKATAEDVLGAESAADGAVRLTIRHPGASAGFFGLRVD